jgi:lysozyme family protein
MNAFDRAIVKTVGAEGDYSNRANDRGGKTRFGITEARARASGYTGDMRDLPYSTAVEIYRTGYWNVLRLDDIARLSEPIALELFDTGVNMGVGTAAQFLQRSLNSFNRQGVDYADMVADGVLGPMTLTALKSYLYRRGVEGEHVLLKALNSLQGARYIGIAEADRTQEDNAYG